MDDKITLTKWIETALDAREKAYAPYSGFCVGAALVTLDGKIYTGCNVENASFGATNCAERTAIFKAISEGERSFQAIVIAGGPKGEKPENYAYPCGMCRQVMIEFCKDDFKVICAKSTEEYQIFSLAELVPHGFAKEAMN